MPLTAFVVVHQIFFFWEAISAAIKHSILEVDMIYQNSQILCNSLAANLLNCEFMHPDVGNS